ncbi:TPA: hypothetical protein VJZ89_001235 [Streptococcus pyogenes]|uniref:hypothetical protein n=1 Tax=Streptococcus pyogenes TaxID=1314 RepID=UPI00038E2468|nr:hypothetical protein [Streptococcus pyogenes]EQL82622.1 hypothetical protein HMPREF1230_0465 [Streptococcus pyogenes GA19681]ERL23235.1 hypothetical protein HMPREF1231_1302 [Streptococcus pyogenes GA06023]ESA51010.1 hypothetical protein HMPREF1233_0546 [Streptococcus pyogenes GA19700]ESA53758.1 hypothetical protein HMPREF1232_0990 [Streptococcus pyogenes GA40468]HEP6153642.1 hypothetical protein [Streptococcus pyogenes ABC020047615]HEP6169027.1 hypothetical protein [Streptococcus pyogenes 
MKYRKKPVEVEAFQWYGDIRQKEDPEWIISAISEERAWIEVDKVVNSPVLRINTLEGVMTANQGDYIIKDVAGEFYPCKPDIFEQTYEPNPKS